MLRKTKVNLRVSNRTENQCFHLQRLAFNTVEFHLLKHEAGFPRPPKNIRQKDPIVYLTLRWRAAVRSFMLASNNSNADLVLVYG